MNGLVVTSASATHGDDEWGAAPVTLRNGLVFAGKSWARQRIWRRPPAFWDFTQAHRNTAGDRLGG